MANLSAISGMQKMQAPAIQKQQQQAETSQQTKQPDLADMYRQVAQNALQSKPK